ncbi:MAG: glycosyltransferase family 2 protein [Longimicrobiales bacterium]
MSFIEILIVIIIAHFLAVNLLYLVLLVLSVSGLRGRFRRSAATQLSRYRTSPLTVPLSVIVPTRNEEHSIVETIHSLLRMRLPEYEIIVVDDGSTDQTIARLVETFDLETVDTFYPQPIETAPVLEVLNSRSHARLRLLRKTAGGKKADAVNAGVNLARYRYVLVTDADCNFAPDALLRALSEISFDAARIVGAGGQVRIRNGMDFERGRLVRQRLPSRLVERFQLVEYLGSMLGNRVGWGALGAIPVLSGAFNIWRRDLLLELGGLDHQVTHEDIEFTLRVHEAMLRDRRAYHIAWIPDAIVWTEVPHRWRDLYAQRKRWQRVVFEVVWKFRRTLFNPRYGAVGMIMMPYLLLFEALGPFFELGAYLLAGYLLLQGELLVSAYLLFLVFSFALTAFLRIVSLVVDAWLYGRYSPRALMTLPLLALLEYPVYRPPILLARVVAFFEFLAGRTSWEPVRRHAAVRAGLYA